MNVVHSLRHSQFLRHNTVFLLGSVMVGALNYLYYPVLGRSLAPGAFGEVQTLVTLFLQLSVFLVVLGMVVVTIVTNYRDQQKRNEVIFEFEKLALLVSLALLVFSVIFRSSLQAWLHFASAWPFILLLLAVVMSVPFTLRGAFLRGKQRFGLVSAGNIIAAGGKLILSAVLVAAGLGTIGAIGGVVLAQIIACGAIAWWAYRGGLHPLLSANRWRLPDTQILGPELRYGGIVLIASLAITLQYSLDVVVIKHYFDATTAGLYAGVAAVARILFFVTASIAQVLLSRVRLADSAASNRQTLQKSLLLLIALCAPVLILFICWPTHVVTLLIGHTYHALAGLLPKLSLAIFIISISNLLTAYYLALRRGAIAAIMAGGAILTYTLILLHHGSPAAVVNNLLIGSAATLAVAGAWGLTERRYGV